MVNCKFKTAVLLVATNQQWQVHNPSNKVGIAQCSLYTMMSVYVNKHDHARSQVLHDM